MSQITEDQIGIAIAGLGFGQIVHLPALRSTESLRPLALWHPNKNKVSAISNTNGLEGYSNWEKLLNNKEIKGIVIATPPEPRFKLALEALEEEKHLFLEKPVCLKSSQIKLLRKIALSKNLSVCVDFEYRAVPLFMKAQKMLKEKVIGDVWFVKLDWLMSSRSDENRLWNWYSDETKGGGVIGALGTHAFDILHWLFGPTKSTKGYLTTIIKERPIDLQRGIYKEVTSEDIALAQIELNDLERNKIIPAQISLSSITKKGRGFWLEIYGSEGNLIIGSDNQKDYVHGLAMWHTDNKNQTISINPDEDQKFSKTWTDGRIAPVNRLQNCWAESIRTGKPIIPGLAEGLASQKVCEELKSSNNSTSFKKNAQEEL
tara:strand:+ start:778 stop:1899 length:1122 start_codon:yes stop_codon:yes gene_type:complete